MNKNKPALFVVLALVLIGATLILFSKQDNNGTTADGTIKIVLSLSLTGDFSYFGNEVKNAFNLLEKKAKANNIQFIYEDNQSEINRGVTIFNKYASDKSVALFVTNNTPFSAPIRELADRDKKNHMALITGAVGFPNNYKYVFRDAITQDQEGAMLANYTLNNTNYKKLALCAMNDDYGYDGLREFKNITSANGLSIVAEEYYTTGNNDFKNIIVKLLAGEPDMIFFVGREQSYVSFINQLRERDATIPLYCTDSFESQTVYDGIGAHVNGVVFVSYHNDLESEKSKDFITRFEQSFGTKPGIYAIDAYVCAEYIIDCIAKGARDTESLNKALSELEHDSFLKGHIYAKNRSIVSNLALYKINSEGKKELIHK
ncbi:MAG: ABC transporter substrate-binding protein [Bdellovibrionota bacterium]|jgi:ABC-type branched-subunit amino acid transport system substrate-binding protein